MGPAPAPGCATPAARGLARRRDGAREPVVLQLEFPKLLAAKNREWLSSGLWLHTDRQQWDETGKFEESGRLFGMLGLLGLVGMAFGESPTFWVRETNSDT